MPQFPTTPGLAELEHAMGALTIIKARADEIRARLGYLISPEQRRALDDLEAAHDRIKAYHIIVRAALRQREEAPQ